MSVIHLHGVLVSTDLLFSHLLSLFIHSSGRSHVLKRIMNSSRPQIVLSIAMLSQVTENGVPRLSAREQVDTYRRLSSLVADRIRDSMK